MAEEAKRQLTAVNDALHQLEPTISRRNAALDRLRQLIAHARHQVVDYDDLKEEIRKSLGTLEAEMNFVEKKENEVPAAVSSLGLVAYLASLPAIANTQFVMALDGQSSTKEYSSLYEELVSIYYLHDRSREYCGSAYMALAPYVIRKPFTKPGFKTEQKGLNMSESPAETTRMWFKQMNVANVFPALTTQVFYLPGTGVVVEFTVDRTFRMVMVLRGKVIENVNVRGSEEHFNLEPKSLRPVDLWTPSVYETFRILTDNARSAILHFYTPWILDNSLRSYLSSMQTLWQIPRQLHAAHLERLQEARTIPRNMSYSYILVRLNDIHR